jgi:hypothetical protein
MPFKKYLVTLQKDDRAWYRDVVDFLFSHLGLFLLNMLYAIMGIFSAYKMMPFEKYSMRKRL